MFAFNRMRNNPMEHDPNKFHPWTIVPENLEDMDAGKRGATYSQSDLPKLTKAKGRLICASITPIEKEFCGYFADDERHQPWMLESLLWATGITPAQGLWNWSRGESKEALKSMVRVFRNHGPFRRILQKLIMGYGFDRVSHMQSSDFDYWEEYQKEYEFYLNADGQTHQVDLEYKKDGQRQREFIKGRYFLAKTREQIKEIIEGDSNDIAILLTIEGSHVYSIDPHLRRVPDDVLFERIESLKTQEHPIFFITFAHHFDNGLCGHAHSIPDGLSTITDQTPRMHEGFERDGDLGLRTARALLDLDEELEPLGGRRILLDIKHMSARTRSEYYNEIIRPYKQKHATWDADKQEKYPVIPIVGSHVCYSGVRTLDDMLANAKHETDHWHAPPFNAWNINLSDEDVRMTFETGGVLGLCFEQRIAGVGPKQKIAREQYAFLLLQHTLAIVDVIYQDERRPMDERKRAWDIVCLGTDYDGFIDPITPYPTVLSLDEWAGDLAHHLEAIKHTRSIAEIGVEELVEKIAWRNAYDFTLRHWPVREEPTTAE
jgi:hypothetical protein